MRTTLSALVLALAGSSLTMAPSTALAQPPDLERDMGGPNGYGTRCLSPNDDGSSAPINLDVAFPFGLNFFGTTYREVFVNTNGNLTFGAGLVDWTPDAFPIADQPMIAAYWGDVDIRGTLPDIGGDAWATCMLAPGVPNGVYWDVRPGRMVITWDRVGVYSRNDTVKMTFQMILSQPDTCGGPSDFDVEFRFTQCEWTLGTASGGVHAQSGFDAGNRRDYVEIPGSRTSTINRIMCDDSNVAIQGVWRFQNRSGAVICPTAGEVCDTMRPGVCAEGRTRCIAATTECNPVLDDSPEVCDNLDNDCDGTVDNEPPVGELCPGASACIEGTCVATCFEGSCPAGLECETTTDICVPEGCVGVTCDEGERCFRGVCGDACAGIVCPHGLSCQAGMCVNLCDGATCDDCTVCSSADGSCIERCSASSCPLGRTCAPDGTCIEAGCAATTCSTGTYCSGGECLDSCADTVCPAGQDCRLGVCAPIPVDAGPPPRDAGAPDAFVVDAGSDAGSVDAGFDACRGFGCMTPPPDTGRRGCSCSVPGAGDRGANGTGALLLTLGLGLAWTVTRRRR